MPMNQYDLYSGVERFFIRNIQAESRKSISCKKTCKVFIRIVFLMFIFIINFVNNVPSLILYSVFF